MRVLVDTNVLSETVKPRPNAGVLRWLEEHPVFSISAITLEELAFGIERLQGKRRPLLYEWLARLRLEPGPRILAVGEEVALAAGRLRARRERKGKSVAQADMLIAASALVHGLTLVTRNVRDFDGCGVALLDPFE